MRVALQLVEEDLSPDAKLGLKRASMAALILHRAVVAVVFARVSLPCIIKKHGSHGPVRVLSSHVLHGGAASEQYGQVYEPNSITTSPLIHKSFSRKVRPVARSSTG